MGHAKKGSKVRSQRKTVRKSKIYNKHIEKLTKEVWVTPNSAEANQLLHLTVLRASFAVVA